MRSRLRRGRCGVEVAAGVVAEEVVDEGGRLARQRGEIGRGHVVLAVGTSVTSTASPGGGSGASRARRLSWRNAVGCCSSLPFQGDVAGFARRGAYHRLGNLPGEFLRLLVVVPDDPHVGEDLFLPLADDLEPPLPSLGKPARPRRLEELLGERVASPRRAEYMCAAATGRGVVRERIERLAVLVERIVRVRRASA